MKLSTKGKYGIKAIVDLALNQGETPVSIKSISQRQGISEYYLEQLFAPLRKAEIIRSIRGAQGGYIINRDLSEVTVLELMNILEGPVEISECVDGESCSNIDCCATRMVWEKLRDSIDSVMGSITIADIINDYKKNSITIIKGK